MSAMMRLKSAKPMASSGSVMTSLPSSAISTPFTCSRESWTSWSGMPGQSTSVEQRCANSWMERSGAKPSTPAMSSGRSCGTNSTSLRPRPLSLHNRNVWTKSTTLSWLVTKPICIVISSHASSIVVRGSSGLATAASASPVALAATADWRALRLSLRDFLPRMEAWILEAALIVLFLSVSKSLRASLPRWIAWILVAACSSWSWDGCGVAG
mmetsp:Transcript_88629/g.275532  ORF Transcript_88629/g.275532 Transcript_88629/m.275532 type:complete len:212 (-) Transcript_88629:532-1167(-)